MRFLKILSLLTVAFFNSNATTLNIYNDGSAYSNIKVSLKMPGFSESWIIPHLPSRVNHQIAHLDFSSVPDTISAELIRADVEVDRVRLHCWYPRAVRKNQFGAITIKFNKDTGNVQVYPTVAAADVLRPLG